MEKNSSGIIILISPALFMNPTPPPAPTNCKHCNSPLPDKVYMVHVTPSGEAYCSFGCFKIYLLPEHRPLTTIPLFPKSVRE
jgi:hypothetical protein